MIEIGGRQYFAPDDTMQVQSDGNWSEIQHGVLLPVEIKAIQDIAHSLGGAVYPSDEELIEWAKAHHPSCVNHAMASAKASDAVIAWTHYRAKMARNGISVPKVAPAYGGL